MSAPMRVVWGVVVIGLAGASPAFAVSPLLKELEDAFVHVGEQVLPRVVNIDATTRGGPEAGRGVGPYDDLFKFFNIPEGQRPQSRRAVASGSGFLYDSQGHIVTNNHLVGSASTIRVRLSNGDEVDAELVGHDAATDLAVIKIEPRPDLVPASLGNSDDLKVGQFAVAVGSPRGLEGSLSFGHITALGREGLRLGLQLRFQDFIQTDAAINLGNSGGPLCNVDGEVIGVNTAIVMGADNLGFAIRINVVKKIIPVLITEGFIRRGFLGVNIRDAKLFAEALGLPDESGAFVEDVTEGSPADRAGIRTYDVIREVNGRVVAGMTDVVSAISDITPGERTLIKVWREGAEFEITVDLDEFPDRIALAKEDKKTLGLSLEELRPEVAKRLGIDPDTKGLFVTGVDPESPAESAGIRHGDVILEVAMEEVTTVKGFRETLRAKGAPGKAILIRVSREGRATTRQLTLPEDFQLDEE